LGVEALLDAGVPLASGKGPHRRNTHLGWREHRR
jgi:hypothetical protein